VIELQKPQWDRLYKEVLVVALRVTYTKKKEQQATQCDRAHEATQRAFERCWRLKPAHIGTIEELRTYLLWGMRSDLHHDNRERGSRETHELAAAVEEVTMDRGATPPAEVIHLDQARANRARQRAALAISKLREALAEDRIALGTVECIAKGDTEPAKQAAILQCPIEEIHAARKRRKRALEKILAAIDGADEKEDA
jgi:hypothetical protein